MISVSSLISRFEQLTSRVTVEASKPSPKRQLSSAISCDNIVTKPSANSLVNEKVLRDLQVEIRIFKRKITRSKILNNEECIEALFEQVGFLLKLGNIETENSDVLKALKVDCLKDIQKSQEDILKKKNVDNVPNPTIIKVPEHKPNHNYIKKEEIKPISNAKPLISTNSREHIKEDIQTIESDSEDYISNDIVKNLTNYFETKALEESESIKHSNNNGSRPNSMVVPEEPPKTDNWNHDVPTQPPKIETESKPFEGGDPKIETESKPFEGGDHVMTSSKLVMSLSNENLGKDTVDNSVSDQNNEEELDFDDENEDNLQEDMIENEEVAEQLIEVHQDQLEKPLTCDLTPLINNEVEEQPIVIEVTDHDSDEAKEELKNDIITFINEERQYYNEDSILNNEGMLTPVNTNEVEDQENGIEDQENEIEDQENEEITQESEPIDENEDKFNKLYSQQSPDDEDKDVEIFNLMSNFDTVLEEVEICRKFVEEFEVESNLLGAEDVEEYLYNTLIHIDKFQTQNIPELEREKIIAIKKVTDYLNVFQDKVNKALKDKE